MPGHKGPQKAASQLLLRGNLYRYSLKVVNVIYVPFAKTCLYNFERPEEFCGSLHATRMGCMRICTVGNL
jgi:hypothetical protein